MGVMMPILHFYEVFPNAAKRAVVKSFIVIFSVPPEALEMVWSTISEVIVSFQARPVSSMQSQSPLAVLARRSW
jgi:hypothetical protein